MNSWERFPRLVLRREHGLIRFFVYVPPIAGQSNLNNLDFFYFGFFGWFGREWDLTEAAGAQFAKRLNVALPGFFHERADDRRPISVGDMQVHDRVQLHEVPFPFCSGSWTLSAASTFFASHL